MSKEVQKISLADFTQVMLKGLFKGCSFAGVSTLTDVELSGGKKNPHFGRVQKKNEKQLVMLFTANTTSNYERMVKKRLIEAGRNAEDFTLSNNWFHHIKGTSLVEKKSDTSCKYLQIICAQRQELFLDFCEENGIRLEQADKDIYADFIRGYKSMHQSNITYLLDGQPIDKNKIIGLKEKPEEGRQGNLPSEFKVITRTFKLSSILSLTIGGITYIVE